MNIRRLLINEKQLNTMHECSSSDTYLTFRSVLISRWPEATQEVSCLGVHVTVDGEELALEEDREKLAESCLSASNECKYTMKHRLRTHI